MRLVLKVIAFVLAGVVVLGVGGYSYLLLAYPKVGAASALRVEATPERVARGKYVTEHVAVCTDCHSQRDWTRYAGPVKAETIGAGGEVWDERMDFPGRVVSKNITPSGLGAWSDGEIVRAFTEGVSRDGTALFPLMPYGMYGRHMSQDDVQAVVAYLRTLPSRTQQIPERHLQFPLPLVVRTIPAKATGPASHPDPSDRVAYGGYLVDIAGCAECHTPVDSSHNTIPERRLSGGQEFLFPNGLIARSANLTPDPTGTGGWTEAVFIEKFKVYADGAPHVPVKPGDFNTPMPWQAYSGMSREDLGAIFAYLQSVKPIAHQVEKVGRKASS
jgi:mono/diheme cytochrome c family protein